MSNLLFLFIFGMRCEEEFGSEKMVVGYFLAGLGGNLLTFSIALIYIIILLKKTDKITEIDLSIFVFTCILDTIIFLAIFLG